MGAAAPLWTKPRVSALVVHRFIFSRRTVGAVQLLTLLSLLLSQACLWFFYLPLPPYWPKLYLKQRHMQMLSPFETVSWLSGWSAAACQERIHKQDWLAGCFSHS